MNILGLNGLGVLPSACIVKDGQLIAMAEEERFTRVKGSFGSMPQLATQYCLTQASLKLEDIDAIAFGWDCTFYTYKMPLFLAKQYFTRSPKSQGASNFKRVAKELYKYQPFKVKKLIYNMLNNIGFYGKMPKIHFVNHHLAHAASSFYTSGFNKAYILVVDGSGENKCTSIWKGEGRNLKEIKSSKIPDSLGWFYQSITEYLGFSPNSHEGKTMALAAYGQENPKLNSLFKKIILWDEAGNYLFNPEFAFAGKRSKGTVFSDQLEALLGKSIAKHDTINQYHKDIAFRTQQILEEIVCSIVLHIAQKPAFNGNLCLAGGVSLNCKMNGKVAELEQIKKLFIPPVSSDTGSALGAALAVHAKNNKTNQVQLTHAYWGPSFSDQVIEAFLLQEGIPYSKQNDISLKVAQLLIDNKIVAWFQGRMEVGSRALGARSILANPTLPNARDYINLKVKGRETWRPFATSILFDKKEDFVENPQDSPFMAIAFTVKKALLQKIPAAIHIDGTTRPQFVRKEINEPYWHLIKHFGDATGVYAVLNTSFNLNEEPIVCTPEQAYRSFISSGLDCLALGSFLIEKHD